MPVNFKNHERHLLQVVDRLKDDVQSIFRLLLTSDVICNVKDDQGYLNMTSSPPSPPPRPARAAPSIPLQVRPLPAPPVPMHTPSIPLQVRPLPAPPVPMHAVNDVVIMPTITSSPSVPVRSKSLISNSKNTDLFESNPFTSASYSGKSGECFLVITFDCEDFF